MSWITTIKPDAAKGRLKDLYEQIDNPDDTAANILKAQSLRPHTMEAHMMLARAALLHPDNTVDRTVLEILSIYTSILNGCQYCIEHHFAVLSDLLDDPVQAAKIRAALEAGTPETALEGQALAAALYSEKLTRSPRIISKDDIDSLRDAGFDDGEILEINQVIAFFAYANRTALGLGVSLKKTGTPKTVSAADRPAVKD